MQSKNTEIREILLGNFNVTGETMRYARDTREIVWAMSMAILATRFFGPVKQKRVYHCTDKSMKRVGGDCRKAFSNLGLLVDLETAPELLACYQKSWSSEPVILTAETDQEKKQLTICAYTRRVLFSRLTLWMLFRKVEEEMGGVSLGRLSAKELREEQKMLKQVKKEEKKAAKRKKKEEKRKS